MGFSRYEFAPERYEVELQAIITELMAIDPRDGDALLRVLKRHPKDGRAIFSKSEIIRGYRHLEARHALRTIDPHFVDKLRAKPIRTESGVAPVTVLTKPFPCPGECIFCPNDVRMPKSYLSMEPGAQRASQHGFDPYGQTYTRLRAFHNNGHRVDKVELIILGGTWSFYPEAYQIWFIKRCFDAMNDFARTWGTARTPDPSDEVTHRDFKDLETRIDGRAIEETYNAVVSRHLKIHQEGEVVNRSESASWAALEAVHAENASSACRCVGLVVETRPDHLDEAEVIRIRRLGATKVQIGYQSLSDRVLEMNRRGHDVAATRRAMRLLRAAGFKIHAHWMPNLYGSTPRLDVEDFERMFADPDFRPDELKLYPCSLIESAELMRHYESGEWRPYSHEELLEVMTACMARVPRYCRLTRVVRDIPSHDILVGNKMSNFREIAERAAAAKGVRSADIRAREIRDGDFDPASLARIETGYETNLGREIFLEWVTPEDRVVAFLRLSLPNASAFLEEIGTSAMIREVHVYGRVAGLGEHLEGRAQHLGLGRRLIARAADLAKGSGFTDLAVISSVGTREYYASLGFSSGPLYQHLAIG
jgi:elongator complex protein 3